MLITLKTLISHDMLLWCYYGIFCGIFYGMPPGYHQGAAIKKEAEIGVIFIWYLEIRQYEHVVKFEFFSIMWRDPLGRKETKEPLKSSTTMETFRRLYRSDKSLLNSFSSVLLHQKENTSARVDGTVTLNKLFWFDLVTY